MSRSGYTDDYDCEGHGELWRGAVMRAIKGSRGQALLQDLLVALDAMPVKELIANEFAADGKFCTLGVIAHAKGVAVNDLDPEDEYTTPYVIGQRLNIARSLACEIMYENDEVACWDGNELPAQRWERMRKWVAANLKAEQPVTCPQ